MPSTAMNSGSQWSNRTRIEAFAGRYTDVEYGWIAARIRSTFAPPTLCRAGRGRNGRGREVTTGETGWLFVQLAADGRGINRDGRGPAM